MVRFLHGVAQNYRHRSEFKLMLKGEDRASEGMITGVHLDYDSSRNRCCRDSLNFLGSSLNLTGNAMLTPRDENSLLQPLVLP